MTTATGGDHRGRTLLSLPAVLMVFAAAAASPCTWSATYKHLGPESCGSNVCHGKSSAQSTGVALNEYRTWLLKDRHAQAYRGLQSPLGASIAARLRIKAVLKAPECLDCHTDNIQPDDRGPRFKIEAGVGCEACHGGSERWIQSHALKSATHAANLAVGMNATETPAVRAQICLGCHMGTQTRIATHDLMAAGHPRLRFELDAFTIDQPAHFKMQDDEYVRRKGRTTDGGLWISGQVEEARRYLTLLQSNLLYPGHLAPEFALYDCYACHRGIPGTQNSAQPSKTSSSGHLRLQEQSLQMLLVIAQVMDTHDGTAQLRELVASLRQAGAVDIATTRAAANQLLQWLRAHGSLARPALSQPQTVALRRELVRFAASGGSHDFLLAEQIVLGVDSLTEGAQDRAQHQAALDFLYESAKTSTEFDSTHFTQSAAKIQAQF
jgi:hypothetical protein